MKKLKFIDLFAGVGGIRLPFSEMGHECVFTSEWDKFAQQTYFANYGDMPHGDITQIDEKTIPAHDVLLGGFPCQAFSIAGKRRGFEDTRGTLFYDIARIIKYHEPKVFLLENVKGLISHNKGQTLQTILNVFSELNYKIYYQVLNAKDFGVPQNRQRIYIIGFKDFSVNFNFPMPLNVVTKLSNILEDDDKIDPKYTLTDGLWQSLQRIKAKHLEKGNGFGYCLFKKDSVYVSTISARYYKDGSEILIEQPNKNPRKLTPREAGRLQGFPDTFKLVCSDTQTYKQFGNSVAVPVIRAIAQQIMIALNHLGENHNDSKQFNINSRNQLSAQLEIIFNDERINSI